jgi:hypothetical protein
MNNNTQDNSLLIKEMYNKYNDIIRFCNDNQNNYYDNEKMLILNNNLEIILEDINEIKDNLDLNYTKNNDKKIIDRINERRELNKKMTLLFPYMLALNMINNKTDQHIDCGYCNKSFFGKDFLRRYRQHFNKKHNHN